MEANFWELFFVGNTIASRILYLDEEHSDRLDQFTLILEELMKRSQAGLLSVDQAAEIDVFCTNVKLGHLFRDDGSELYATEKLAETNAACTFNSCPTPSCPSSDDAKNGSSCDKNFTPAIGSNSTESEMENIDGSRE
ncbi:hypothetical protein NECAME_14028 [Necator americanus]|uniref:Uncharacterized protein n=1 Tax=Necator americanus TaxID=51031 RepID=W2SR48_NECAM|nr:hypothetical protein NECAME_14028 [Necator americanus]ETN71983.1 hypothetical protein NECAME_14028 [Necator americanus]